MGSSNSSRDYILSTLFQKLSEKRGKGPHDLERPIVPVKEWVRDTYYVGQQGLNLYPFWIKAIENTFTGDGGLNNNIVVFGGGLGCTPLSTYKATSHGYLSLSEIKSLLDKEIRVSIQTEYGDELITDVHFIGKQPTKILNFTSGFTYECTNNHLFRVIRNNGIHWIRADLLKPNDYILSSYVPRLYPSEFLNKEGKYAYALGYSISGVDIDNTIIPDCYRLFSKEETCLFLAGLFDSLCNIEYISNTNVLSIYIIHSTKNLLSVLQQILLNLGIQSKLRQIDSKDSFKLSITHIQDIKSFYDNIPIKVGYKKQLLTSYLDRSYSIHKGSNNNLSDQSDSSFAPFDYLNKLKCYSLQIESIDDSENECGDIEVGGSHTYISDGIINHNTGKSTAGVYLMVRFLYELSCYINIHRHVGINMDTSALVFLLFCITKQQIKNTTFKQLKETLDGIPYFRENFPRYTKANDELRFPKNILVLYGSGAGDAIGTCLLCSLIDEANFFSDASGNSTDMSEVSSLHRSLIARQESRFKSKGVNRSLSIVVSSSTYSTGFTEELKKRSLTDPSIRYYRARVWDVKPQGTYSDEVFYVFCGNDKIDPFIIRDVMDLPAKLNVPAHPNLSIKDAVALLPNELRVLVDDVPIDFKTQYEVNLLKSIQDVSGFSIQGTGGLFNNRDVFISCIDDTIPTLFLRNEFVIETQNNEPQNTVMYYMSGKSFQHPECPRYIHIDLSLTTDTTGICCCYKYGDKEVDGVKHPIYVYDFCVRILPPPPPKKISISRVEEFIIYLKEKLHLTFGMISFDQYQSSASQQRLQELGFPVRYQSVDRTDAAYLFFVDQMFLGTVKFNSQFADSIEHELFNLQHNKQKHKVDHILDTAHGYTKDVCDAVVGSIYNAFLYAPKEVDVSDTLSLSYLNSDSNIAQFTEDSQWLFDDNPQRDRIKEAIDKEYLSSL